MVAILYISAVRISEAVRYFWSDYCGTFASFVTEEYFCAWHMGTRGWF